MSAADDEKVIRLASRAEPPPPASEHDYGANPDDRPPEFSDDNLALRFTARHGDRLRYVAKWGKWLEWDGTTWRPDETMRSFDLVRAVCRHASAECNKPKAATAIASAKTVAAVEKLAKGDRRHAATVAQWDADPWLLNTPRGVIDLRTGDLLPHEPGRHMTKSTAVVPFGDCPMWLKFLSTITAGDEALIAYLRRTAGYCLTGSIREHTLFFGYGTGRNGKGTFLNTLTGIMGDYAIDSNVETFTAQATSRHLTELARLQGARLVVAQETEEGKRLAMARVKAITGGDPITANFMRQDLFTYHPQFKLFIAGNHKPALGTVDEAIRARFNLIPFTVYIPKEDRDKMLADKLRAEWPGILQWMIDGCLEWQATDLAPPNAVLAATDTYFEAEDTFAQWTAACCNVNPYAGATSSQLFKSWQKWAKEAGEEAGSQKRFAGTMEVRGFVSKKSHGSILYNGIGLRIDPSYHETEDERS
ncbi:MAG: hypothetical protein KGL39_24085 [Patescibacteria group bacterium]|nr:hypothetical protein [Patescibacteria group bacterium]